MKRYPSATSRSSEVSDIAGTSTGPQRKGSRAGAASERTTPDRAPSCEGRSRARSGVVRSAALAREGFGGFVTFLRLFLQALEYDRVERGRIDGVFEAERFGRLVDDVVDGFADGPAAKRLLAGDQFVEHNAQA